jgi:hypothetical protein
VVVCSFLSYNTPEEWKAEMMKKIPHKIDMGAVPPDARSMSVCMYGQHTSESRVVVAKIASI